MADTLGDTQLHWADIVVIVLYFVFVFGVGIWSSTRSKRDSVSGYFLAGRNMNWILVGASLFASNIGSGHFVGLAGSGAASGIGIAAFELNALFVLTVLGWLFVPVYMSAGVYTMPEYLRKRFGGQRIRVYLSVLALILYVFTKISADLFAGAIFIKQAAGWDLYVSVIGLLAIAAIFTITGGLTAVIWTDFVQTILMLVGAFILMIFSFNAVGGYEAVMEKFMVAEANLTNYTTIDNAACGKVPHDSLHFFRDPSSPDLPWTGVVFGLTVSAVWYWCSDQVIVQRALASKSFTHAKAGTLLAGALKLLPMYLLVFPGMIARILYPEKVACADPITCERVCGIKTGCTNIAYPLLVLEQMPNALRGMMLAVMMAALMSSLTSIFNSSSTIFTIDIWTRIRKQASDVELLIVGRLFVLVLVVVSIAWIPVIQQTQGTQLFVYIQNVTSYLSPPVCAVYVLAIFWGRINEKGAFWGLMVGLAVGIVRFALEYGFTKPACGSPDKRPEIVQTLVDNVHYLHFGIILFIISAVCTTVISLLTEPIDEKHLYRLTYWTRFSTEVRQDLGKPRIKKQFNAPEISVISDGKSQSMPQLTGQSTEQLTQVDPDDSSPPQLPLVKRIINFVCGIAPETNAPGEEPYISPEVQAREAAEFLNEDPFWRRVVNISAIVLLGVGIFMWAYYA